VGSVSAEPYRLQHGGLQLGQPGTERGLRNAGVLPRAGSADPFSLLDAVGSRTALVPGYAPHPVRPNSPEPFRLQQRRAKLGQPSTERGFGGSAMRVYPGGICTYPANVPAGSHTARSWRAFVSGRAPHPVRMMAVLVGLKEGGAHLSQESTEIGFCHARVVPGAGSADPSALLHRAR